MHETKFAALLAAIDFALEQTRGVIAIDHERQDQLTAARDRLILAKVDANTPASYFEQRVNNSERKRGA